MIADLCNAINRMLDKTRSINTLKYIIMLFLITACKSENVRLVKISALRTWVMY